MQDIWHVTYMKGGRLSAMGLQSTGWETWCTLFPYPCCLKINWPPSQTQLDLFNLYCACGGQRTTRATWLSPTMWLQGLTRLWPFSLNKQESLNPWPLFLYADSSLWLGNRRMGSFWIKPQGLGQQASRFWSRETDRQGLKLRLSCLVVTLLPWESQLPGTAFFRSPLVKW